MKKTIWIIIIVIAVLIIGFIFIRSILGGSEDSWIKDSRGIWVKHGNPSETLDYVKEQQDAVSCAFGLYDIEKNKGIEFSSQCLGTCGDFVVDIVHVLRTDEDNLVENQCDDFRSGKANHFIELDRDGEIVMIV